MQNLDFSNLQNEISNEKLKQLQIIVTALNIGVLLFFFVTMILYFQQMPETTPVKTYYELYNTLLAILAVFTFSMFYLSKTIPDKLFGKGSANIIAALNSYYIIKLALLEAAVFFGLVVFLLSIFDSVIYSYQIVWLSIIPLILFFIISYYNFPTIENVITLLKEKHQMNIS